MSDKKLKKSPGWIEAITQVLVQALAAAIMTGLMFLVCWGFAQGLKSIIPPQ